MISSPGKGGTVAVYEIRTLKSRRRTSMIAMVDCANDLEAIMRARELHRKGEAIEVWREGTLVYRTTSRMEHNEPRPKQHQS
jgi:hypothetical protein